MKQNTVTLNEEQLRGIIAESIKRNLMEKHDKTDILYRGGISADYECLWLTTSKDYAELYGDIQEYEVPISVLDKLACEDDAMEYLIDITDRGKDPYQTEEFYLYDRHLFDINQMKRDGYSGYYYHEMEYKCVNVCLFRNFQHKLLPKKPQI